MAYSCLHSGAAGDALWSLAWLQAMGGGAFYLRPGVPSSYPIPGHPSGNLLMSEAMADSLLPLIAAQPYVYHAGIWRGQPITHYLDLFRELPLDLRQYHLAKLPCYLWPVALDLSRPWLFLDYVYRTDKIVINRTTRYRNPDISYSCLDPSACLFIGTSAEYRSFAGEFFECDYQPTANLLEAARYIAGCRYFCGNQSACWVIADALKVRRVLEVSPAAPNAGCSGANGFEAVCGVSWRKILAGLTCGVSSALEDYHENQTR